MRWNKLPRSTRVENRRGSPRGRVALGGIGTLVVAGLVILLGGDLGDVLELLGDAGRGGNQRAAATVETAASPEQERLENFAAHVLGGTELVWGRLFERAGAEYRAPRMVTYTDRTPMGNGRTATSDMGPFYYPAQERIYLDVGFFDELEQRFGAAGDTAWAYVLAHEVAHHVQHLTGRAAEISRRQRADPRAANRESVRLELNADYLAGVWAHHLQRLRTDDGESYFEPGDVDEAIRAARAIGDDRLQKMATGAIVPAEFTHGTSEQRMRWFGEGYRRGDPAAGDVIFRLDYDEL